MPKGGGYYQVGQPYEVAGLRYSPREDPAYDRVGSASWYGELFHGRRTANGEIYDMDRLSAAHPTLPLPVYARVTNLNNGRSLIVRINDRGPFARDRIIDLSRRSAEALGFRNHGTATVRVKYLGRAPLNGNDSYEQAYLANQSWARVASKAKAPKAASIRIAGSERLPAENPENLALQWQRPSYVLLRRHRLKSRAPYRPSVGTEVQVPGLMVQAGTFKNKDNAERARATLSAIAPVEMASIAVRKELLFLRQGRTLFGPDEAKAALMKVTQGRIPGRQSGVAELEISPRGFRVDFCVRALDICRVRPCAAAAKT